MGRCIKHVCYIFVSSIRHEGNLFRANGSVYWQDDQNIALDFFSDYLITDTNLLCALNASIISTIPQVSSFSASFYHRQTSKRFDTNIHVQVILFIAFVVLMRR